ncbi:c-type cytochrome [Alsobacter sp. SYSU M60028]|uniref:C-type cytochrome n=1 Tax=Alsobacter ponti TaxID=2962936 RepID=A0ABT1LDV3_9HYPH|nr:c-type cytochrome [Alsobacter ponti]MCP8939692.1 c-type cytochrome [Alsobacter ponti]
MNRRYVAATALALSLLSTPLPSLAGDGSALFDQECADCHSVKGKNKKGPTLAGVIGRKAGTVADFTNYSDAMKAKGIVWSPDKLDAYIKNPRAYVAGGTMKYDGLADADARAAIIAYLAAAKG